MNILILFMKIFDFFRKNKEKKPKSIKEQLDEILNEIIKQINESTPEEFQKQIEEALISQPNKEFWEGIKNKEEHIIRLKVQFLAGLIAMGEVNPAEGCEEIIRLCNDGLKINPNSAYLLYFRGYAKRNLGDLKGAMEDLNKCLKINPKYADAYVERGYTKQKMGDTKGAEEDYKKAREINPFVILPGRLFRARGITWYILISPIPSEKELEKIKNEILNHSLFQTHFAGAYLSLHDKVSENKIFIKLRSPPFANHMLREEDIEPYYKFVYDETFDHIKSVLNRNGFKLLGYDFGLNWAIPEPEGIIPMVQLKLHNKPIDKL